MTSTGSTLRPTALTVRRHSWWTMTRIEAALLRRNVAPVLFMTLLPLAAIALLGILARRPEKSLGGLSYLETYLPILMMFVLVQSGVVMLGTSLASYREKGVLRRLATTPVRPARLLAAEAALYLGVGIVVDVVMLGIGVACGVPFPAQLAGFVLSLLLVAAAMLGIGMLITALASREQVALAVSITTMAALMYLAGLWTPRATMSPVMRTISDYSPLGAGSRAVQGSIGGHWPNPVSLLVIAGYATVCGALARRYFRLEWE